MIVMSEQELLDLIYGIHPFDDVGMYKEEDKIAEDIPKYTGLDKISVTKGEL